MGRQKMGPKLGTAQLATMLCVMAWPHDPWRGAMGQWPPLPPQDTQAMGAPPHCNHLEADGIGWQGAPARVCPSHTAAPRCPRPPQPPKPPVQPALRAVLAYRRWPSQPQPARPPVPRTPAMPRRARRGQWPRPRTAAATRRRSRARRLLPLRLSWRGRLRIRPWSCPLRRQHRQAAARRWCWLPWQRGR